MKSTVKHEGGMAFSVELAGHHFMIDAHAAVGGQDKGPPPKFLLLPALGGCTAMDVISILRKMRQEPSSFRVELESDTADHHPKILKDLKLKLYLEGELDPARVRRALELSRDRYCGVSAMLKATAEIEYQIILNGEPLLES